jgi:anion-transporting  ArsA/GET3 family ATPase
VSRGASRAAPAGGLAQLLADAPLVVCLGSGGVGKTTLSSVIALHQAACARRALVLTIDPARRLADALGIAGLTNDPAEVTSFARMHPGGTLSALMLDPAATFDHLVAMVVPDPVRRKALLGNRYYQHLSRSLAGTLEYTAVERLHTLTASGLFDRVVLDTPPTTNALDFLEAPDRLSAFFSENVTRWFMPESRTRPPSWTARLFNRAGSSALSLLGRVAGETFVEDTVGFVGAFADLFGTFRSRGVEVGRLLRQPSTVFLVVCAPDSHRLAEAKALDRKLSEAGCRVQGFIVNRVDTPFLPREGEVEATMERATALLGGPGERARVEVFLRRLEALRQARESSAARHAEAVAELRRHAGSRPVFTAPNVPPGESPRAALLAVYVGLFPPETASAPAPRAAASRRRRKTGTA